MAGSCASELAATIRKCSTKQFRLIQEHEMKNTKNDENKHLALGEAMGKPT
jgi:hypothetical protein